MNALTERLEQIRERIDELSLRERVLIFLAAAAVLAFLWQQLFMQPLAAERDRTEERIGEVRDRITEANEAISTLLAERDRDPDAENRARLEALEDDIAELDRELEEVTGELIDPARMARVLQRILEREQGLDLVSLESLPARPLLDDAGENALGNVFRHGLRLEMEGEYLAVLHYLRRMEDLDSRFFWSELDIEMREYPRNRVVITVHTLSLREGWIGV